MRIYITIITFLLISALNPNYNAGKNEIAAEDYAVYSAYLNEFDISPDNGKPVKLVVVNNKTAGPSKSCSPENVAKYSMGIAAEELKPLLEELQVKNKESTSLQKLFKIKHSYVLLDEKDFGAYFKTKDFKGWDNFYKKYPDSSGYITLSRIGFNTDLTRAILFRSMNCGVLCGSGDYILFEKTDGKWKAVKWFNCWVS